MPEKDSRLGKSGRDKITGFTGMITAAISYLYGTTQLLIESNNGDESKHEQAWFEDMRVEVIN